MSEESADRSEGCAEEQQEQRAARGEVADPVAVLGNPPARVGPADDRDNLDRQPRAHTAREETSHPSPLFPPPPIARSTNNPRQMNAGA